MSATLPPGWTGNDADHHATAGPASLRVHRRREKNPFTRTFHRVGPYLWTVHVSGKEAACSGSAGCPTALEAREAAILGARLIAFEVAQGCDWLAWPPATGGERVTPPVDPLRRVMLAIVAADPEEADAAFAALSPEDLDLWARYDRMLLASARYVRPQREAPHD